MSTADLVINLLARDRATSEIDKVKKSLTGLEKAQAGMGRAAQLLGAGAVIAFGTASVKAYAEAEKSQVRLQEAYRKFPAIASVSIQSMRDLNTAIMAKTGADDDELAAAEANLAMYNLTGQQIQQLIPLVNDLAVAKGIGLTDAAKAVGKAFMGNAKGLKDVGIAFKATGDRGKDFQTIMTALTGQVGGAGDAFGKTAAGGMARLQQSFQNLQEEVGGQLAPALQSLTDALVPLLDRFGKLPDGVKKAVVWIGAAGAAALLVGPRILSMAASLRLIFPAAASAAAGLEAEAAAATTAGTASATAAPRVGLLAKAMGAVGIGVTVTAALYEGWGKVQDAFGASASEVEKLKDALAANDKAGIKSAETAYINAQAMNTWQGNLGLLISTGGAAFPFVIKNMMNASDASDALAAANEGVATASDSAASAGDAVASSFQTFTAQGRDAKQAADDLKAALDALGGKTISNDEATRQLNQSYADAMATMGDVTGAVTKNHEALNLNTQGGRDAQAALQGIAQQLDTSATAWAKNGKSAAFVRDRTKEARAAFLAAADKAGLNAKAANRLADAYGLIPEKVETTVLANYPSVTKVIKQLNQLDGRTVTVNVNGVSHNMPNLPGGNATGGLITGPGSDTSDSIPRMLSNGEFVVRAAAVRRVGVAFLSALNSGTGGAPGNSFASPAAGLSALIANTHTLEAAQSKLKDLLQNRHDESTSIAGSIRGSATMFSSFDLSKSADAMKRLADAKERLRNATTREEQDAARADIRSAKADAKGSAHTAGNLLAGLRAKAGQISSFYATLKRLKAKHLPASLLKQLVDAGPVDGSEMASILDKATPAEFASILKAQNSIDANSGRIGGLVAGAEFDPLISRQREVVNTAAARARASAVYVSKVELHLDSKKVAQALAEYKKAMGGRPLGLS